MATPSYSLTATSMTVTFHIVPTDGYIFYRLFFRRTDDTTGANMILSGDPHRDKTEPFSVTVSGLDPNTSYTANVYYGVDNTSAAIVIGAQTITTSAEGRPSNWSWTTPIAAGNPVPKYRGQLAPITAVEWNAFCERINHFREYKSLKSYTFTTVSPGMTIASSIVWEAIYAISAMAPNQSYPNPDTPIRAMFWIQLAAALNAIT